MKKSVSLKASLFLILGLTILATGVAPAFAATTVLDHQTAEGYTHINIPDHPEMVVYVHHNDWAQSGGPRDVFRITMWFAPLNSFVPVRYFTDNAQSVEFYKKLVGPYPVGVDLVKPCDIQVCRLGRTVFASWTISLKVPEIKWYNPSNPSLPPYITPAVTIPPGFIIFNGFGDAQAGTITKPTFPGLTYTQTITWTGYDARATFVCPMWHYLGPVGESTGAYSTTIWTDALVTTAFQ